MPDLGPFVVAGLGLGAVYALSGVGLVVLHRSTGVLNLAHGAVGAVAAHLTWELVSNRGWSVWAAAAIGLAVATCLTALYGASIGRRLAGEPPIVQAVGTLGMALIVLGAIQWYWEDVPRRLALPFDRWGITVLNVRVTGTRLVALALAIVVTVLIGLLLRRSSVGLRMRSLADDRAVAAIVGVNAPRVDLLAWLLAGALAGATGVLLGNLSRVDAATLTFLVVPAVATAVIARFASIVATLVAGVAIGVAESVATPFQSVSDYRAVVPFVAALVAVAVAQRGARPPLVSA